MFKSMLKNRRNHEIFLLPVFHFLNSGVFFEIIHVLRGLKMKKAFFLCYLRKKCELCSEKENAASYKQDAFLKRKLQL